MTNTKRYLIAFVLAPLACFGIGYGARTAVAEPGEPFGTGAVCYNNHGYPLPQPGTECPPCWHGAPPSTTLPLGTADPCTAGLATVTTTTAAPPPPTIADAVQVVRPPVPVVLAPAFTG